MKIDLTINDSGLRNAVQRAREQEIIIPTLQEQMHPETIPENIRQRLRAHFADDARLAIDASATRYRIELIIPISAEAVP